MSQEAARPLAFTREQSVFVGLLLAWFGCALGALLYIAAHASSTPYADDSALFYVDAGGRPLLEHLWTLHNEHRLPLPKLVQYALYEWTGDIRSGMYLQAAIYAATALGCILAARRLRGGSRPWDVFFALMWLQTGNWENLLMGFQLCIAIPGACVCCVLCFGALSERRLRPSHALASGASILALPLCGGAGLLQAPCLALWSLWLGWTQRSAGDARERLGARIHLGFALAALALCGLYLVGFERPPAAQYSPLSNSPLVLGLANLCAPFGPDYESWRPLLMPAIALGMLLLGATILRQGLRTRDPRALGTCAVLGAGALLVCGLAFGRPVDGPILVANRYIPLPAPLYVGATLGALALLRPRWREACLVLACVLMLIALPGSIRSGSANGEQRSESDRVLRERVAGQAGRGPILESFALDFQLGQANVADWLLRYFSDERLPPFDAPASSEYPLAPKYESLGAQPLALEFAEEPQERKLEGRATCLVKPGTTLDYAVVPAQRRFVLEVGLPELLLRSGKHPGVHGRVVLLVPGALPNELGRIELDAAGLAAGPAWRTLAFEWQGGVDGILQLSIDAPPGPAGAPLPDRVGLRDARIE